MKLTCPSCGATFRVEPAQLGPAGRKVRCGDCRHAWHQEPLAESEAAEQTAEQAVEQAGAKEAAAPFAPSEAQAETTSEPEPPAAAVTPEVAPEVALGATPGAEERISRRAYSKPARPQRKAPQSSLAIGWVLFVVVVAGLAAGFYFGRTPLVAMVPGMTRLYDLVGVEEEIFELGLELRDVKSVRRQVDGESVVAIQGLVVNLSDRLRQVPPLRASVTDAEGKEVDRWTFRADSASLPPGGSTSFDTVAKNPPREGNLSIDFVIEN
jgi:predicted Zn finger-like uncharacterized protein